MKLPKYVYVIKWSTVDYTSVTSIIHCRHVITILLPRCMECNAVLTMRFLSVRLSVCPSVRLSVRPSVKRVHCDKTEEKSVRIFIPCERLLCLLL